MRYVNIKTTFLISSLAILFLSCTDFFDQVPNDRMTIDEVFQRRLESEQYLANVYNYIRNESDQTLDTGTPFMGLSDEADVTYTNHPTYAMNLGNWNANSNFFNFWTHYYRGIRSATYFMQNLPNNKELQTIDGGPALIKRYIAEARALRAEFYAALLKQYGPVVIIPGDKVLAPDATLEELALPRNSYDECIEFIVSEFDAAAAELPDWYDDALDYGRMNKTVCMALKARALLYAASPLWNGNQSYSNFKNQDGKQLVNQTYDPAKWKSAAEAAKAVIDLERFSLHKQYSNGKYDPLSSLEGIFLEAYNKEIIFCRKANTIGPNWEWRCNPRHAGGTSGNGVTQSQVDAYQMANGEIPILGYEANGQPIVNPASGYVERGFSTASDSYTESGTWNMYTNREPRFYASVTYNGAYAPNRVSYPAKTGLFYSGNSGRQNGANNFSRTGYLVRKNLHPNSRPNTSTYVGRPLVLLRLAELYLNYAESLNEYEPGHPDILTYVNLIRERADIPALPPNLSQDELRDRIRLERRIELAFERHRWFDTRRWKIASQTDGGDFYGMNIDAGMNFTDTTFYKRVVFEERVFTDKNLLFPIPQSEIERGFLLVQNPGW
jgi:hypothetical protein